MKLNLLFIVMDLFTVLAYPFVFIHSKLLHIAKGKVLSTRQVNG
jgi:hypothetical protein